MKTFAFLIKSPEFHSLEDIAYIHDRQAAIIGVRDIDDAVCAAVKLKDEGISCIEVCGAFTEDEVRKLIEATDGQIPIGFVTHLKEQDELFSKTFG